MFTLRILLAALFLTTLPAATAAQNESKAAVDFSGGYAAFVDESAIAHFTAGVSWRWHLTDGLSVGPEMVYMRGPGSDRDVFITGKLLLDFRPRARMQPYIVADGGVMLHRSEFLPGPSWHAEGAASGGGGLRVRIAEDIYAGPEVRIGWEPHIRITGIVTWRPGGP